MDVLLGFDGPCWQLLLLCDDVTVRSALLCSDRSSVNIRHFRSHPVGARRTEGETGVTAFSR